MESEFQEQKKEPAFSASSVCYQLLLSVSIIIRYYQILLSVLSSSLYGGAVTLLMATLLMAALRAATFLAATLLALKWGEVVVDEFANLGGFFRIVVLFEYVLKD